MKIIQLVILGFLAQLSYAQRIPQDFYDKVVVETGDGAAVNAISDSLAAMLPQKMVYLQNETHSISIGSLMKFSLYHSFSKYKGVNYILQESGHSIQFGRNLFMKYGDVNILLDFDGLIKDDQLDPIKYYKNTIHLYETNKQVPDAQKIRFIGIDFEIDDIGGVDPGRRRTYYTALKYFKKYAIGPIPAALDQVIDQILGHEQMPLKALQQQNALMRDFTNKNSDLVKAAFGEFYLDFSLMINSSNSFPSDRRDDDMFKNFLRAYQLIKEKDPNGQPRFFGTFGSTRVKPGKNGSLASIISRSEIFANQVSLIGQAYVDCKTSYFRNKRPPVPITNSGLYVEKRNRDEESKVQLRAISDELKSPIILLGHFERLQGSTKYGFTHYYDAVLIHTGF